MPHIIIVDDDDSVRSVVVALIRETFPAATIFETASSLEVLKALQSSTADLLITDCEMPEMDGPTLVRTLRLKDFLSPIIMVSGSHEAETLGGNAGIDKFVSKVRVCGELPEAIKSLLAGCSVVR